MQNLLGNTRTNSSRRGTTGPVLAFLALLVLSTPHESVSGSLSNPQSHLDIRSSGITRQTSSYSCGAAAVATLLTLIFGVPASEDGILEIARAHMVEHGIPWGAGIPALSLVYALTTNGIPTAGYSVTASSLQDYFFRGGLPVIAHLRKPQRHYVIALGLVEEQVVLADPGWGWRTVSLVDLEDFFAFSGVVLVPLPSYGPVVEQARRAQVQALSRAVARDMRLRSLSESLL